MLKLSSSFAGDVNGPPPAIEALEATEALERALRLTTKALIYATTRLRL
jgi:hypothetical protein